MLEDAAVTCPHCWQEIVLEIDPSIEEQDYIEDCPVCCQPMRVTCHCEDGQLASIAVETAV
jgi:hypothetical protein